jgi:hypothetical protein
MYDVCNSRVALAKASAFALATEAHARLLGVGVELNVINRAREPKSPDLKCKAATLGQSLFAGPVCASLGRKRIAYRYRKP